MAPVGLILGLLFSWSCCDDAACDGGVNVTTFMPIPARLAEGINRVVAPVLEELMVWR